MIGFRRVKHYIVAVGAMFCAFLGTLAALQPSVTAQEAGVISRGKLKLSDLKIPAAQVVLDGGGTAIIQAERKEFTLAECSQLSAKPWNADTIVYTKTGKSLTATEMVKNINQVEQRLNDHGYSLHPDKVKGAKAVPKTGLKSKLTTAPDVTLLTKQRAEIAKQHIKATAEVEKQHTALLAKHDKANAPATIQSAQAGQKMLAQVHQNQVAEFKKIDTKKLTKDELTVHKLIADSIEKQTKSPENHTALADDLKKQTTTINALAQKTKFLDRNLEQIVKAFGNQPSIDEVKTWHFGVGKVDNLEGHVDGTLEIHATSGGGNSTMHAKHTLELGFAGLSHQFKAVDVLADLSSTQAATENSQLQLSAKFFGNDLFKPINEKATTNNRTFDENHPFDDVFLKGDLDIIIASVGYELGLKGTFHLKSTDVLAGAHVSSNSSLDVSATLYADVSASFLNVSAKATGSVNLFDEHLNVVAAADFGSPSKAPVTSAQVPRLTADLSAKDKLTLLSGEIVIHGEVDLVIRTLTEDFTLYSFSGVQPVDGFVVGPIHVVKPPELANPGNK